MSLYIDRKYLLLLSSRLRNFKHKKDSLYNFSCPLCGDSKTNTLKARGYVFSKGNTLLYRCHNCGASMSIRNFIKHMDISMYQEYVMENYMEDNPQPTHKNKPTISTNFKFGKVEDKQFKSATYVSDLPKGHHCLEYIKSRRIPREYWNKLLYTSNYKELLIEAFPDDDNSKIFSDERIVIPFYDEYNDLIGMSGRALNKTSKIRYINKPSKKYNKKLVYGLERLDINKRIIVVEGQFDSLFLENAIASCDSSLHMVLSDYSYKDYVLVYDNEPRNKEIVNLMQKSISLGHPVVIWDTTYSNSKDINDMILNGKTKEEIMTYINNNIVSGITAQLKFNLWKKI